MIEPNAELVKEISPGKVVPGRSPFPTEPLIRIRPGKRSLREDAKELWEYRELFLIFIWRDLKARYKQTVLGIGWAILQPLLMALVFAVFFGIVVRVPSDGVPYLLFAYSGLLVWLFFSQAVLTGSQSLSGHGHMINKVYFPRLILPLANICVRLIDLLVAAIVLAGLMFYYGVRPDWHILLFPVLVLQLAVLAFGLSAALAALHLRYRDVGAVLPVILQMWMFSSPIVYPSNLVGEDWRRLYFLNPVAGIVENLRAALFGLTFDTNLFLVSLLITAVLAALSVWAYYAMSKDLADIF
jgi:lipopolysaccharide transport system permease protein